MTLNCLDKVLRATEFGESLSSNLLSCMYLNNQLCLLIYLIEVLQGTKQTSKIRFDKI